MDVFLMIVSAVLGYMLMMGFTMALVSRGPEEWLPACYGGQYSSDNRVAAAIFWPVVLIYLIGWFLCCAFMPRRKR